jgi:hypothetical protein
MLALSQSSGNLPVSIDFWKITVKLSAIWLAHSLRIRFGIPSGPDAFDGFMSWSSFSTPFSLMVSFGMGSSMCLVVCGMAVDLSMEKTDLNCWINMSSFSLLSLTSFPLLFNGETPMLSFFLDFMYFQNGLVLFDFSPFSMVSFTGIYVHSAFLICFLISVWKYL